MDFSIVTPSFRSSKWLKLCIASVADQPGVTLEHIVQDSVSDDGTLDWLPGDPRVKAFVEKDRGMYDAVNRGFARACGDFLAYINCDEQYLPGALRKVKAFFVAHPETDVVFGDAIVVDEKGEYCCERRALLPQRLHTWTTHNLSFLTAAMFMQRSVVAESGILFDPGFRAAGDAEWTLRLLDARRPMAVLPEFLSAFAETGQNLATSDQAVRERRAFHATAPLWARAISPLTVLHFRWRRWRAGHYRCRPHDYALYTFDSPGSRKVFHVSKPSFRWVRR
jgi:glycosyltransferase involved in cell wall biosynthesis